jgi:hypothetical protein
MKQSEPFMCKTYLNMKLIELYLRNMDCSFNVNRMRLRKFIQDHVGMAACAGATVSTVIMYGFSKSLILACQHVVSHILRHNYDVHLKCRFVICIGKENDPASNVVASCRTHLNGFYTIIRFDSVARPDSKSNLSTKTPQLAKICNKMCDAIAKAGTTTDRQRVTLMKEIDSYITNTSSRMSHVMRHFVSTLVSRSDIDDSIKHSVVQNCAMIDSEFPGISNSKTVPIVLSQLMFNFER